MATITSSEKEKEKTFNRYIEIAMLFWYIIRREIQAKKIRRETDYFGVEEFYLGTEYFIFETD